MRFLRLAKKNKEKEPATWQKLYEMEVEKLIRARYSISAELAILRQRDTKPEEYAEYNEYAEMCKAKVKAMML